MSITLQELARPPAPAELEALARIHRACFGPESWSALSLKSSLALPTTRGWIARAEAEPEPRGFLLLQTTEAESEILTLAVLPSFQRQGLGRALLEKALHGLSAGDSLHLEVAEDNVAACRLYAQCGFTETGRRPAYYRRPAGEAVAALRLRHYAARTRT